MKIDISSLEVWFGRLMRFLSVLKVFLGARRRKGAPQNFWGASQNFKPRDKIADFLIKYYRVHGDVRGSFKIPGSEVEKRNFRKKSMKINENLIINLY